MERGEESDILKRHVDCVPFGCWGNAGKDPGLCCGSFRSHSPGGISLTTVGEHFNRIPEGRASAVLANSRRESCVPSPGAIQQVHTIVWVRNDEGPSRARSTLAKPSARPAPSASSAQRSLQGAQQRYSRCAEAAGTGGCHCGGCWTRHPSEGNPPSPGQTAPRGRPCARTPATCRRKDAWV